MNKILYKVIDISHWNGKIDFQKVIDSGVTGVIIKCGGSETKDGHTYQDKLFEDYYIQAKKVDLFVGAYYFGVGSDYLKGTEDALKCRELLKDKQFELPIYLDYECSSGTGRTNTKKNKKGNTEYCKGFCHTLENYNYFVGIYGSDNSTFKEMVNKTDLLDYTWWVARYSVAVPNYATENMKIWQFTSKGKVNGISGNTDINYVYQDFPNIIRGIGKNGY